MLPITRPRKAFRLEKRMTPVAIELYARPVSPHRENNDPVTEVVGREEREAPVTLRGLALDHGYLTIGEVSEVVGLTWQRLCRVALRWGLVPVKDWVRSKDCLILAVNVRALLIRAYYELGKNVIKPEMEQLGIELKLEGVGARRKF